MTAEDDAERDTAAFRQAEKLVAQALALAEDPADRAEVTAVQQDLDDLRVW